MRLKDKTLQEVPRAIPSNLWRSVVYHKNNSKSSTFSNKSQDFKVFTNNNNSNNGNDYVITPQEQEKYDQLFNKLDTMNNQYVTGEQSKDFFLKSGLSTPDLARIWELADMNKVGRLTREEFYIAMHLIRQKKSGMKLPTKLPTGLIPPSLRKNNNKNLSMNNNTSIINNDLLIDLFECLDISSNEATSSTNNNTVGISNMKNTSNKSLENEINQLENKFLKMKEEKDKLANELLEMKLSKY